MAKIKIPKITGDFAIMLHTCLKVYYTEYSSVYNINDQNELPRKIINEQITHFQLKLAKIVIEPNKSITHISLSEYNALNLSVEWIIENTSVQNDYFVACWIKLKNSVLQQVISIL